MNQKLKMYKNSGLSMNLKAYSIGQALEKNKRKGQSLYFILLNTPELSKIKRGNHAAGQITQSIRPEGFGLSTLLSVHFKTISTHFILFSWDHLKAQKYFKVPMSFKRGFEVSFFCIFNILLYSI